MLFLAKLKLVASLQTSEFPLEIPRSQKRNIQYTTTLANIPITLNRNEIMNSKAVHKLVDEFTVTVEKYNTSFFGFFKNISTLSVALIGLLIGLKPAVIPNQYAKLFFLLSIILIGLCILFSLIVQHYELNYREQANNIRLRNIQSYILNPSENIMQKEGVNKKPIYVISEILTYFCFGTSIISLILYVAFLEFYC